MPFSAAAVANEFLRLAHRDNEEITPLKMQKLVYVAHGWYLAITGQPLLAEQVQAWQYGPVIGSLYQQFKHFGARAITGSAQVYTQEGYIPAKLDREADPAQVDKARAIIERVWREYGKFTAAQLTTWTHTEGSPWSRVLDKEKPERQIPNQWIAEYFANQAVAS